MNRTRAVWLNGRLVPEGEPHLFVADRGFQLGDGVFETLRARRGIAIELDAHLVRLHESAAALAIDLTQVDVDLDMAIHDLLVVNALAAEGRDDGAVGDASVRITCSRGSSPGPVVMSAPDGAPPTLLIQAWPYSPPQPSLLRNGIRAITSSLRRDATSPMAAVKTTSRADHVMARLEANRAGADDAIHLTLDGRVAEATSANVFVLREDCLLTPALDAGILAGTTRSWLLAWSAGLGLGVNRAEEVELKLPDLLAADEAFVSATVSGLTPLTWIDGLPIGSGRPGPVTVGLREAREQWIDAVSRGEAILMGGGALFR